MGCDGGTIPTRDELVRLKKKPEQRDKDGHRIYKWQHCAISQEPLRKPVVACELGRLYNKESIIELLLNKDRTNAPANTEHIEKLKDVIELKLHDNPAFDAKKHAVGDGLYNDALISPWICPVTGLEMNGRFKFVFAFTTGKVVAERAIKVLRKDPAEAPNFKEEDVVTINPEEEELDLMNSMMNARRARVKAAKKAAKEAKRKNDADFKVPTPGSSSSSSSSKSADSEDGPSAAKKPKPEELSAFKDQKKTNDPSKIKSSKPKSSVQNDPNASEVYKRLFSSHKDAVNKKHGHWITFDPRYN
eukprot:TRINITY_DN6639_c1_g1_i10.p1 TRINITY_DN6639_c1_g1~~TRINITY_DN6639_c1_g1_i10.p1  ORF type:complete len:303 (-),score=88.80 TRINITY_DN6639_c1_g1_i10:1138-2046(-)